MNSLFKTVTRANDISDVIPFEVADDKVEQQIFIQDLVLDMFIGVFDEEKKQKQRVILNVNLDVLHNKNWQNDSVDDVVSYADIVDLIQTIARNKNHIHLVETFANMIIEECFKNPQIRGIEISVAKPDIIKETSSVGVKMSKKRS